MQSNRNEDYTIWTGYDGMDENDIREMIDEICADSTQENPDGKE